MYKSIMILSAIVLFSAAPTKVLADDMKIGTDVSGSYEPDPESLSVKNKIDELAEPYDDVKISDGISAGFISEREENVMSNKHRDPGQDGGTEVGVGLSLSF